MDARRVLERRTVVVEGDRIVALGPADSVAVPTDAVRVDGRGRWLMPGLADLHVHLFEPNDLLLFLANGVTTIRNMGGADSILELRGAIEAGERLGPTIWTSGNWLDGDPPVRSVNTVLRTPAEARREVDGESDAGFDFVKVYETLAPDVYAAIVDEARRRGIPVTGHVPRAVGLDTVLRSGQVDVAHAAQVALKGFPVGFDEARVPAVARAVAAHGVAVTTTLVMFDRMVWMRGRPDRVRALLDRPEARYLSPGTRRFWTEENPVTGLPPSGQPGRAYAFTRRLVPALRDAGVTLLLGTDTGLWGNEPGWSIHEELELLTGSGLTPYQALRAGTVDAQAFLRRTTGRSRGRGVVAVGEPADLVLVDGNPLEDVANASRVAGTVVRGRWLPASRLRSMLDGLAARYAREGR